MGVEIPAGFCQVTWGGFHGATDQHWACTLGFEVDASPGDWSAYAEDAFDAWAANMLGVQSSSTALLFARIKEGPGNLGPSGEFNGSQAGTLDAPTSPSNVAVLISKRTASGGRANRGRMFVPGIPETSVANTGIIDSGVLANWQAAIDALIVDMTLFTPLGEPVVLHDESSPVSTPTVITSFNVQALIATQRRRLRR